MTKAALVEHGITIAVGLACLLTAQLAGRTSARAAKVQDTRQNERRQIGTIGGIAIIAMGIGRLIWSSPESRTKLPARPDVHFGHRVQTTDDVITVHMPGRPETTTRQIRGDLGLLKHFKHQVSTDSGRIVVSLNETHFIDTEVRLAADEYLENLIQEMTVRIKGKATKSKGINRDGLLGRSVTIVGSSGYTLNAQVLLGQRSVYQLNIVTPNERDDSSAIYDFFSYLKVEKHRRKPGDKPPVFQESKPKE